MEYIYSISNFFAIKAFEKASMDRKSYLENNTHNSKGTNNK